jgi:hypothetical protein
MGYALCMGTCFACHKTFAFNPLRVPSIRVSGSREPICRDCIERANPLRIANGLPAIVPAPDAYEACDEKELGE